MVDLGFKSRSVPKVLALSHYIYTASHMSSHQTTSLNLLNDNSAVHCALFQWFSSCHLILTKLCWWWNKGLYEPYFTHWRSLASGRWSDLCVVTKLRNDPTPEKNLVFKIHIFIILFFLAHPCILGCCAAWMAEYGDKSLVMTNDLTLSYMKSLEVQTHLSFSPVGISVSFIQQALPDPKSVQALCGKKRVDKIWLCPQETTF